MPRDIASRQQYAALTPRDKQIGFHIRQQRMRLGMAPPTLARALGITEAELAAYESGETWISTARLFEIADTLSVDLAFFYAEIPAHGSALDSH
jgi:transcriptional regulator with XRE-family HTH domain